MKRRVWAHRGASGYVTENTMEAFRLAIEMGSDGIEIDVQLTSDNRLAIFHDETLDRLTGVSGYLADYTMDELKGMEIKSQYDNFNSHKIPELCELLELLKDTKLTLNIELKTGIFSYEGIEKIVIDECKKHNMLAKVIISSFNHQTIRRIRKINKKVKTAILVADVIYGIDKYANSLKVDAIHPPKNQLMMKEVLEELRESDLDINVWTLNTKEELQMAKELGIKTAITNYPDLAFEHFV